MPFQYIFPPSELKLGLKMALVCDIKSDNTQPQQPEPLKEVEPSPIAPLNDDLEDGEIEDDDEEEMPEPVPEQAPVPETVPPQTPAPTTPITAPNAKFSPTDKFGHNNRVAPRFDRPERHNRYEEKKRGHLTEAEKSVMHLHKLERIERLEREKRDRYKREQVPVVDDFACNIEKAIASVLKKDKKSDDDKEEEEKRGKKRKKKDKEKKKAKQRKMGSPPKPEEYDENEMMNVRRGSPDGMKLKDRTRSSSPRSDYDSYDSSTSSDRSREDRKDKKKEHGGKKGSSRSKNRDRIRGERKSRDKNRDQKTDGSMKDGQDPICLFYIQGKCNKGDDCPYSHEVSVPMKLELCKFYLMECCAKGDKCLYMHSEFPCKFYHTGLRCQAGDSCKFAHGKPLHEGLKQILYKHIETAPKEILGDFPRMSRDGALNMINQAQKALETKYAVDKKDTTSSEASGRNIIPSLFELNIPVPTELLPKDVEKMKEKGEKPRERNRPSRWQDADPSETLALQEQQQKQQQLQMTFGLKGFYSERGDQDMRVNSNGDIDMRTLPPQLNPLAQTITPPALQLPSNDSPSKVDLDQYMREAGLATETLKQDVDIRTIPQDIDIRQLNHDKPVDVDIRQISQFNLQISNTNTDNDDMDNIDEPNLEIVMDDYVASQKTDKEIDGNKNDIDSRVITYDNNQDTDIRTISDFPANLPKKQRELFLRIQAQQKENVPENQKEGSDDDKNNIDWYSDDDDDCRLTIKDDMEEPKPQKSEEPMDIIIPQISTPIKPGEVIEKLGDLSKIDISAEVTKLLSSISQAGVLKETKIEPPKDPRLAAQTVEAPPKPTSVPSDPRRARLGSTESRKTEKLSIYEQGSISIENAARDVDLRNIERDLDLRPMFGDTDLRPTPGRPDIDLRQLTLPFKAIQNYTPASEIDASINSHPPMSWKVYLVEIPRPDYTGLKLSAHEAQNTGDPRLRKIFRLSIDEKDSPASPKESSKVTTGIRADPRRRREEKSTDNQMSYAQQLNMLQTSAFYQSLTSSQKVLLNEELSTKSDHTGTNDPTLNGILTNLGLIPGPSMILASNNATAANTSALSILANVNSMNPIMGQAALGVVPNPNQFGAQPVNPNILSQNPNIVNQMAQSIVQPGLLGAAPGVPNLPPDFQLNFDPRQGGLLGNAPPINYNDNSNFNYNEEYYEEGNNFVEGGRGNNGGGRGGGRGRGGFRGDRQQRRGRNFNNRNNGRNFRNRNRSNRSRTPP